MYKNTIFENITEIDRYYVKETIGAGSHGLVRVGIDKFTNQKVALKFVDYSMSKSRRELHALNQELEVLQILSHKNIVKLFKVIPLAGNCNCFVLEYVDGLELFDMIVSGKIKEKQAANLFSQLLSAVEYCHSKQVVHRDIKPENVLVDSKGQVRLVDFGLSASFTEGELLKVFCGSPLYSAPEVIFEIEYLGPQVDIWSMGVLLFTMVCGNLPWDGATIKEQIVNIVKAKYEIPGHVSSPCANIIEAMIQVNPKKRPSLASIRAMLTDWQLSLEFANNATRSFTNFLNSCEYSPSQSCHFLTIDGSASDLIKSVEMNICGEYDDSCDAEASNRMSPIRTLKRNFIRAFQTHSKNKDFSTPSPSRSHDAELDAQEHLRLSKDNYKSNQLSPRNTEDIMSSIERCLGQSGLQYQIFKHPADGRYRQGLVYEVEDKTNFTKFSIEICRIKKLEGFKALKLKKISGDKKIFDERSFSVLTAISQA